MRGQRSSCLASDAERRSETSLAKTRRESDNRPRGAPAAPRVDHPARLASSWLRRRLVLSDATAFSAAWALTLLPLADGKPDALRLLLVLASVTAIAVFLLSRFGLYRARVCFLRTVEVRRLARVSLLTGVAVFVVTSAVGVRLGAGRIAFGCVLTLCTVTLSRCFYASWLRARRMEGQYVRPLVVVGQNDEGIELEKLIGLHPELGFRVVAVAQTAEEVRPLLKAHEANGVLIAVSALETRELNSLVRDLLRDEVHVAVSNGLLGFDHHRLRPQPFAREPLFYIEGATVSTATQAVKRAIDVAGASIGLLFSLPVLAVAAIAIKVQDGGPILFRQQRVGRHGRPFTLYKFRSMIPNADRHRARLQSLNQREGPIFKADNDPRVTRVGRVLRATSIDELPQLLNVLGGSMSLVGPRPAIPAEVAQFDEELLTRHSVRPGITGLWQVEARENASFQSYRRLDLFYIENLSIELDFVILLDTVTAVLTGIVRALLSSRPATAAARSEAREEMPVFLKAAADIPAPCALGEGA